MILRVANRLAIEFRVDEIVVKCLCDGERKEEIQKEYLCGRLLLVALEWLPGCCAASWRSGAIHWWRWLNTASTRVANADLLMDELGKKVTMK